MPMVFPSIRKKSPVADAAPIFVLGFYRGGTTLLQRLLNCFQGLAIWGEHSGFLREFARAYCSIRSSELQKVNVTDYAHFNGYARRFVSWANGFDANEFLAWQRSSVQQLFGTPPDVRWGFKEIRYNDHEMMLYLTALYPGCRILFLTRSPEDILVSRVLVRWETRFHETAEITRLCETFETEWHTGLDAARRVQESNHNLAFVGYEALLQQRCFAPELLEFLKLDPRKLNRTLFETTLEARAGSSFGDMRNRHLTGKEVALRIGCVKDFVADSVSLRMRQKDASSE